MSFFLRNLLAGDTNIKWLIKIGDGMHTVQFQKPMDQPYRYPHIQTTTAFGLSKYLRIFLGIGPYSLELNSDYFLGTFLAPPKAKIPLFPGKFSTHNSKTREGGGSTNFFLP